MKYRLCSPMNYSLLGSSFHGILQARILEWVAMPSSRGSSWLRDWTHVSYVSCIGRFYPSWHLGSPQVSSVQSLSRIRHFVTLWTAARQASLSIANYWSLLSLMSIESVMPSNHLILCRSLLLLPSIFLSIRVFSNEPVLRIRWPKYWSFSFNISPSNECSRLIPLGWTGLISWQSKGLSRVLLQRHSSKASIL